MTDEKTIKLITIGEINEILADIARNGEGAERFRALKMIAAQETGSTTLPEPISDQEIIQRLGRLMKGAGNILTHFAYHWAWPKANVALGKGAPQLTESDMDIDRTTLPVSLKQLYRKYPEIKRSGVPHGYPYKKSLLTVKLWCQQKAYELERDRRQAAIDAATKEPDETREPD